MRVTRILSIAFLCAAVSDGCLAVQAAADEDRLTVAQAAPPTNDRAAPDAANQEKTPEISEAREQEILEFIQANQPKLSQLLNFLRERRAAQYTQALRDTARSMQRLENLAKRDEELHAIELDLWRVRSETRLLVGQISAAKSEAARQTLEKRLERLLQQEVAFNLQRLKLLRKRTAEQLAQYDTQIATHENESEALVSKSLKQWQNRIAKQTDAARKRTRSQSPSPDGDSADTPNQSDPQDDN